VYKKRNEKENRRKEMLTLDYHVLDEQGEIIASFKYPADREGFEGYLQEAHDDFNYSTKND